MIPACLLSYQMLFAGKKAKKKKMTLTIKFYITFDRIDELIFIKFKYESEEISTIVSFLLG